MRSVATPPDGAPERIGRALGRLVVGGRAAARQAATPEARDKLVKAARAAEAVARRKVAEHGPHVADVTAQRAVDRVYGLLRARVGLLAWILEPHVQEARQAAGNRARRLAESARPDVTDPGEESSAPKT
jgi:hypothetical protein